MLIFSKTRQAIGDSSFEDTLKKEIEQCDARFLPLQQGLSAGGYAIHDAFQVMLISVTEFTNCIIIKAGIFYHGVVAGCSCADDPSPTDITTEYCEMLFEVDRATGETIVALA